MMTLKMHNLVIVISQPCHVIDAIMTITKWTYGMHNCTEVYNYRRVVLLFSPLRLICLFFSNRKGKVIILYDWTVNGKIEGKACDATESSSGTLEIKNLSFENELEEVEVSIIVIIRQ